MNSQKTNPNTSLREAIRNILNDHPRGLRVKEISEEIRKRGEFTGKTGDNLTNYVSSKLSVDIKAGDQAIFSRPEPGLYILKTYEQQFNQSRSNYSNKLFELPVVQDPITGKSETIETDEEGFIKEEDLSPKTGFIGVAGEYAVCSELLLRGYLANIVAVDDGVDIIAHKNNQRHNIQVKTSASPQPRKNGATFVYKISHSSYERSRGGNMFYIFVARFADLSKSYFSYIIMHNNYLHTEIERGNIERTSDQKYVITISYNNNNEILLRKEDISHMLNRRDIIQ